MTFVLGFYGYTLSIIFVCFQTVILHLGTNSVLYRDAKLSRENAGETKHKINWVRGGHIDEIRNALYILDHNGVYCLQHFQVLIHGWVLVTSQHHIKCQNMQVTPPLFDPNSRRDHDYVT